tara:strand:+ start:4275 stop:4601 length:327 start_codon:yes stop_codon:yes gene_type:complete
MPFNFSKVLNRVNSTQGRGRNVMLLDFLLTKKGAEIGNHVIQFDAIQYIRTVYGDPITPDSASRIWRKLREEYKNNKESSQIHKAGLSVVEFKKENSSQKYFKIGESY